MFCMVKELVIVYLCGLGDCLVDVVVVWFICEEMYSNVVVGCFGDPVFLNGWYEEIGYVIVNVLLGIFEELS